MQKLQEMYNILNNDKKIKEYFDIEVRFNIMLADVNKIISESVKIYYKVKKRFGLLFKTKSLFVYYISIWLLKKPAAD